jgi:hypothetical protein
LFRQRLAGHSVASIARHLNERGIPCPSSADPDRNRHRTRGAWPLRTIAVILANPRYTGRQIWNRRSTRSEGPASKSALSAKAAHPVSTVVQSNFTHIYQAELFHTANRGTAIGIPYAASRLISTLLPLAALTLLSAIGPGGLYACCALLLTGLALTIRLLGPHTDNRRLDAI